MNLTRSTFIRCLEKKASEESLGPDYHVDSGEVANSEHKANLKDTRSTLGGLFARADESGRETSSLVSKTLPSKPGQIRETSNPLMKLASELFYPQVSKTSFMKQASPAYQLSALHSFLREIDQIDRVV